MREARSGVVAAALAGGLMMLSGGAIAAPAPAMPEFGGQSPLVEKAQIYFGVPGVGFGPAPYYGPGPYYGPRPYYGGRRYYRSRCRVRYTPYGPRRVCW